MTVSHEPTEAHSRSITTFNCHNLTGMRLSMGGLCDLNSFGCQPNSSPRPPQRLEPLVWTYCSTMATGQTRGGASFFHLVIAAAQALLWYAGISVCVCVCLCVSKFLGCQTWKPICSLGTFAGIELLNFVGQIMKLQDVNF